MQRICFEGFEGFEMKYICRGFVSKQLKRNKATGVDEPPPGMLKDIREYIADPLCYILNLSVETATVPSKLKIARLIPIHKSGSRKLYLRISKQYLSCLFCPRY